MINYILQSISFQVLIAKTKHKNSNPFKYLALIPVFFGMLFYSSCSESVSDADQVIEKQIQTQYRYYEGELVGFKGRNLTYLDDVFVGKWPENVNEIHFEDLNQNEQKEFIVYQQNGFLELGKTIKLLRMPNGRNAIGILMPGMEFDKTAVKIDEISFLKMENTPVFPDCKEQDFECFFLKLDAHFTDNFNKNIVNEIFVSTGIQKVTVEFSIDTNGEVTGVKVESPHIVISNEVKRVIESLPKMAIGMKFGKPKKTKYKLPFKIKIN